MNKKAKKLSCLLLITTLATISGKAAFILSGEVQGEFYNNLGQVDPLLTETHQFELITDFDGSWRIRLSQIGSQGMESEFSQGRPLGYTGGHDDSGTHVKYSHHEGGKNPPNSPVQGFSSGEDFPSFLPYNARVLWFMYCSNDWVDSKSMAGSEISMPLLWKNEQHDLSGFGFRLKRSTLTTRPFLPLAAKFIRDTSLDLPFEDELKRLFVAPPKDLNSKQRFNKQYNKRLKFWPENETAGEYRVIQSKTYYGYEIPEKAQLVAYPGNKEIILQQYPKEHRPELGKYFAKFEVVVNQVQQVREPQSFLPPVTGVVGVQDTRFRKKGDKESFDTVSYTIASDYNAPTNFWLSSTNPFLATLIGSQLEFNPIMDPTLKSWYRLALYALLGLALVAIPLFSLRNFRSALQQKNKTK